MKKKNAFIIHSAVILGLSFALVTGNGCQSDNLSKDYQNNSFLEEALEKAKDNRGELEKVLHHYKDKDPQKYEAACFLIRNMPGKCYTNLGWKNSEGDVIDFEALDYKDLNEASAAFDKLEKEHGEISYRPLETMYDIEIITADFLKTNIDQAFESWKNSLWTGDMPFDIFCERVLPYRATNEPLDETWRKRCQELFPNLKDLFPNPDDLLKVQKYLRKEMDKMIQFSTLYYLHPTDQSFSEMINSGKGRCEDMSNLAGFLNSAFALPMAKDYTPYWPKSDNNHAWEVMLDKNGKAVNAGNYHAAKIYRKNYSHNRNNLIYRVKEDKESIPRWLASNSYTDVTSEYHEVGDAVIEPDFSEVGKQDYIYICVFNGGDWRAIHWAEVKDKQAVFTDMGLDICYIAAAYVDKELVPVSHPFILDTNKKVVFLDGSSGKTKKHRFDSITPKIKNVDTGKAKKYMLKEGTYFLYEWKNNQWQVKQCFVLNEEGAIDAPVNENTLYWITKEETKNKARIFTIEDGRQIWW